MINFLIYALAGGRCCSMAAAGKTFNSFSSRQLATANLQPTVKALIAARAVP